MSQKQTLSVNRPILDDRPNPHVCKFHEIHSKSVDFIEIPMKFMDSALNPQISLESMDVKEIRSNFSDLNRETS